MKKILSILLILMFYGKSFGQPARSSAQTATRTQGHPATAARQTESGTKDVTARPVVSGLMFPRDLHSLPALPMNQRNLNMYG